MDNLTYEQRDMVLRFLLRRMPMNTRHELMRTLPVAYLTLYPGTRHAVLEKVTQALRDKEGV
jgi:phage FluMu gp28-like protein